MTMGVWGVVQWWEEWQLRILVLGSLGLQWFLLLAAPMRKYTIPRCIRTWIWLAYISSDALAIYALATLFNRHSKATTGSCSDAGNSRILEVLWAPVLLIHLGGQEEVTAYGIEDNELWLRHSMTLVSQVTVALYAFYKSWPSSSDGQLLASAVLLFVLGILSFCEKPWALRRASINQLAAVSALVQGTREKPRGWDMCFTELEDKKMGNMLRGGCGRRKATERRPILLERDKVHMILSDMSLLAAVSDLRKRHMEQQQVEFDMEQQQVDVDMEQQQVVHADEVLGSLSPGAERSTNRWLRKAFALIYTRANVAWTPAYLAFHLVLVPALHVAAITLFVRSDKRAYNATDVKTTYVLLGVTAALDVLAAFVRLLLYRLMAAAGVPPLCETVPQYSVVRSALRRGEAVVGGMRKCAARIGCPEDLGGYFTDSYVCCKRRDANLYAKVAGFISADLVSARGVDLASYRSFTAPNWALSKDLRNSCTQLMIRASLRQSFDRSVLVWHIATDLYFRRMHPEDNGEGDKLELREVCTQAISNYMAHLLKLRPDMLMTGSRQHLLNQAVKEVETILKGHRDQARAHQPHLAPREAIVVAIEKATLSGSWRIDVEDQEGSTMAPVHLKYPLISDACRLARELMSLPDRETRQELMYRVWLGMLFYSASMCRGYLHAKSLGEGGEFLSFVWLVLSLKGAQTLADKLQMPDPDPAYDDHSDENLTVPLASSF